MTAGDEIERLARANPVADGALGGAVPAPPAPGAAPRRSRRALARIAAVAGALVLAGLIVALIVAAPSDDAEAPAEFDGTMRVSVLDRPQADADRLAQVPAVIDPGSVRFATGDDLVEWYVGRRLGDPDSVCLIRNTDALVTAQACGTVPGLAATGLVATLRGQRVAGVVPDGVDTVTIGTATATVQNNVFVVPAPGTPPEYAYLSGPAAAAIRPAASVVVARPTSDPTPVVAVELDARELPGVATPTPPGAPSVPENPLIQGTLGMAAAAMPFTVLAPAPPPASADTWVFYSRDDPRLTPQVTIDYLPAGAGQGTSLIEAAEGSTPVGDLPERRVTRAGRTYFVSGEDGPPGQRRLRIVLDGTDVRISGSSLPLEGLLDVADSLRPVTP